MRQKSGVGKEPAEEVLKDIRRATRRHFSAEDKDPHCAGRPARRVQYCGTVSARGFVEALNIAGQVHEFAPRAELEPRQESCHPKRSNCVDVHLADRPPSIGFPTP